MCLILFSWKTHSKYKLVLAANRDEFYDRPTLQAGFWKEDANILAGRDEKAGGTWIGITKTGRFAALTNYRDPQNIDSNAVSRGQLTTDFLKGNDTPEQYIRKVKNSGVHYNGFNLLIGDGEDLLYYNNVNHSIKSLEPGLYGLSNGFLDENWPKVKFGKAALKSQVENPEISSESLLKILNNNKRAIDNELPKTGVPIEWERSLSPLYIEIEAYGTRCSTLILTDNNNKTSYKEKTYAVGGQQESMVTFEV